MRPTLTPARPILSQLVEGTPQTDGTEIEITRTTLSYASEQRSAELRLSGESGWGRWLVGAYWFDEDKYGALGLVRSGFTPAAVLSTTFTTNVALDTRCTGRVYFLSANTTVMSQASYTLVEVTYRFGN